MEKFYKITSGEIYDRFKEHRIEYNRQWKAFRHLFDKYSISANSFSFRFKGSNSIKFGIGSNKDDREKFKNDITVASQYEDIMFFKNTSDIIKDLKLIAKENRFVKTDRPTIFDIVPVSRFQYRLEYINDVVLLSVASYHEISPYEKSMCEEIEEDEFWQIWGNE